MDRHRSAAAQRRHIGIAARDWQHSLCETFFDVDVRVADHPDFFGTIRKVDIGPVACTTVVCNSAQNIRHEASYAVRSREWELGLIVIASGIAWTEHAGCSAALGAGDAVIVDSRKAFEIKTRAASQSHSLSLPESWLRLWFPYPERLVGRSICSSESGGAVLSGVVASLAHLADEKGSRGLYADHLATALALALADDPIDPPMSDLTGSAVDGVRHHAHDTEFEIADLSTELGISKGYLHRLFRQRGTTFAQTLLEARLGAAARMLRDDRFSVLSLAEIGWRSGFKDYSNFHRRFCAKFGVTPGKFRSLAI